jgi:hypothetical protein
MASFSGSANITERFGTAENFLDTLTAVATAPNINDWTWDLTDEGDDDWLDVEFSCKFTDDAIGGINFNFDFTLIVELWQISPSQMKSLHGTDSWIVDDNSANWLNLPTVHTDILVVKDIPWRNPASNEHYKCTIHVYIENEWAEVSDYETDSWFINMQI